MSSIFHKAKLVLKMQSTINNSNNYKTESSKAGMSICIPRAFANITEARVRKVFDKLGIFSIARVDMVQRKNEKGDAYQRIFVHIQDWTETADAQKARDRLLAGKELKIVYDDPWFWKASLNTWAPKPKPETTVYDRKPRIRLEFEDKNEEEEEELPYEVRWGDELARRKRQQVRENVNAATSLMSSLTLEEDRRPYAERRVDPIYCEQDVQSGFRDRREPRPMNEQRRNGRVSRFSNRSPPRDQSKKEKPVIASEKPNRTENHEFRDHRDGHGDAIYQKPAEVFEQKYVFNVRYHTVVHDVTGQIMTLEENDILDVIEFNEAGDWAYVENKDGMEDWVPSVYLTLKYVPVRHQNKPTVIAAPLPEVVPKVEEKPVFKMDPDVKRMISTFLGRGISEITEEIYRNNAQYVRDLRQDEMDKQKEDDAAAGIKPLNYGVPAEPPKRKPRKVLVEEEVKKDA